MKHLISFLLLWLSLVPFPLQAQTSEQGIPLPPIPEELQTPTERASYLVAHYWDLFSFSDSLQYLQEPEKVEQAIVNYIDLFRLIPTEEAEQALTTVLSQADCSLNGFFFFYNILEKYLYDLGSPLRNENLFIPVLEKVIASNRLQPDDKIRPTMLLESVRKNQVGSPAANFTYTRVDNSQQQLQAIPTEYTLLLFFDPDCDECHQAIQELEQKQFLNQLIQQKKLTILAVYPGEEVSHWKMMVPNLPATWIIGYDKEQTIYEKELYDILGFPTIYLLDSHKNVLLKEASPQDIEEYFKPINP